MKQYPVNFISITQDYTNSHTAIDLGWKNNPDVPIFACDDGIIEKIYYIEDGGNVIRIKYDDGIVSEFMHLKNNSIIVKEGQKILKGERVATMGDTGLTTGPHLHVVIKDKNGNRQNPLDYLYAYPNQEVSIKDINRVMKYISEIDYIVKKGDTLSSIASKYNVAWKEIYDQNKQIIGPNPNLIKPGQQLIIYLM